MARIGASSRVLAVMGDPVVHSLSPAMHNAAIAVLGLDAVYVAFRVPVGELPGMLRACRAAGISGNLTIPLKVPALELVEQATPMAERAGAVNTFWPHDGALHGDNTDVAGITQALTALHADSPWLLAGTGGTARAVAVAAAGCGAGLVIRSRDADRARAFAGWAGTLGVRASPDDGQPIRTAINTTPRGLTADDPLPIPLDRLTGATAALDLVYHPGETAWVRACRAAGLHAADGRTVLVAQGVHAFERFFPGTTAPRAVMEAAVRRALGD